MPSIDLLNTMGIDAATLSERARALLMKDGNPGASGPQVTPPGNAHILLWTLLVMRAPRLRRFADYVGMLGAGATLRLVLEGRRIAAFREQLGHDLYHFGMLRAPLIGTIPVAPSAFEDPARVSAAVSEVGMAALQAFCHGPDGEHLHLRARLSARLREIAPCDPTGIFVPPPSGALLQRVLREVEPVLASAFDGIRATA